MLDVYIHIDSDFEHLWAFGSLWLSFGGFEVPKKSGIFKELPSRWPDLCHDTVVERIIRGREQYLSRNKDRARREDETSSATKKTITSSITFFCLISWSSTRTTSCSTWNFLKSCFTTHVRGHELQTQIVTLSKMSIRSRTHTHTPLSICLLYQSSRVQWKNINLGRSLQRQDTYYETKKISTSVAEAWSTRSTVTQNMRRHRIHLGP